MIGRFETENLQEVLRDFYTAIGIRISIFDDEFHMVTEYPEKAPKFCARIRETEAGRNACNACDRAACLQAKKLQKPYLYECHAGITEAVTPIRLSGGVLGYAILAHMLPKENYDEAVETVCQKCEKYGIPRAEVLETVSGIKAFNREKIIASVKMLDAVAAYLYISQLVSWENEDISQQIDRYIERNLDNDLSNEAICAKFYISRTKLYQLSQKSFGMGISQYVIYKRMEQAKTLLRQGKSVADVAAAVGIPDYNYFSKLFKKTVGVSPTRFR